MHVQPAPPGLIAHTEGAILRRRAGGAPGVCGDAGGTGTIPPLFFFILYVHEQLPLWWVRLGSSTSLKQLFLTLTRVFLLVFP